MNRMRNGMLFILTAVLLAAALLTGCNSAGPAAAGASSANSQRDLKSAPGGSAGLQPASSPAAADSAVSTFASAFKLVNKNPLNEDLSVALWLAASDARNAPVATAGAAASNPLSDYVAKFKALVADKGVHYIDDALMKVEYWIKDGKFKKADEYGTVDIFDGTSYVEYNTSKKTGTRYTKQEKADEINPILNGMLSTQENAGSYYTQQKDQVFGKFNCAVFYMDVEMMGFKGVTLYVDKDTGLLVYYVVGDPKDKKHSMPVSNVTSLTVGGFGDDVFTVPADITLTDG